MSTEATCGFNVGRKNFTLTVRQGGTEKRLRSGRSEMEGETVFQTIMTIDEARELYIGLKDGIELADFTAKRDQTTA